MIAYLDSSALVKLYVLEPGSARVRRLVEEADVAATSAIAYAEIRSAMARRHREGDLSESALSRIKAALLADWEALFVLPATGAVARIAGDLAEEHGLGGMDAVHLASALWLARQHSSPMTFAARDERLARAAEALGFDVVGSGLND
ncbi:MAG: type II toxin-antitoxin system VapC family toxin [Firmicutes bacterium]|nr:type II toxin-antitoxin system VapC family toxin [Bacillota bacterium]